MSPETRQKWLRLGSRRVAIVYPRTLDGWFDGLVSSTDDDFAGARSVHLTTSRSPGRYDVVATSSDPARDVDLGEALAIFWERVSFHLVDELRDAMAFHAAGLRQGDGLVLLPAPTGSGKTRLSLWYRARGFDLGTDEIVTASIDPAAGGPVAIATLARPVIVKHRVDASGLLRPDEAPAEQQASSAGLLLRLDGSASWDPFAMSRGVAMFPRFTPGAALTLTALTAGETSLRLMENCLNVRNLPRGGLALAVAVAGGMTGIALEYGATEQLEGTLDVLTRQLLASPVGADDLAALCAAFTAGAAARRLSAKTEPDPERPAAPAVTQERFPRRLTVGMATYDDFDGVYFTVQSIRVNNPELDGALELVVIDNNPGGGCSEALSRFGKSVDGFRYVPSGAWSGTAIRNAVFEEASSPFVVCLDSHVLVAPGALSKLIAHFEAQPDTNDLIQGPLVYDDLNRISTHMVPQWRKGLFGAWATDPRGIDPQAPAFDIPMQGLGLFACRRAAWPGFNAKFRGFGGEEGYIHEKVRQRGGRTLCLPFLRWVHRFNRPMGTRYVNRWEDRMRNYMIGFAELGLDTAAMEAHFTELLGAENAARIFSEIRQELAAAEGA